MNKFNKLGLALSVLAFAPFASAQTTPTALEDAQDTIAGYITTVGTTAASALLIAGGVALVMVVIKYVRRAGK